MEEPGIRTSGPEVTSERPVNDTSVTELPDDAPTMERPIISSSLIEVVDANNPSSQAEDSTWHAAPLDYGESSDERQTKASTEFSNDDTSQRASEEPILEEGFTMDKSIASNLINEEMNSGAMADEERDTQTLANMEKASHEAILTEADGNSEVAENSMTENADPTSPADGRIMDENATQEHEFEETFPNDSNSDGTDAAANCADGVGAFHRENAFSNHTFGMCDASEATSNDNSGEEDMESSTTFHDISGVDSNQNHVGQSTFESRAVKEEPNDGAFGELSCLGLIEKNGPRDEGNGNNDAGSEEQRAVDAPEQSQLHLSGVERATAGGCSTSALHMPPALPLPDHGFDDGHDILTGFPSPRSRSGESIPQDLGSMLTPSDSLVGTKRLLDSIALRRESTQPRGYDNNGRVAETSLCDTPVESHQTKRKHLNQVAGSNERAPGFESLSEHTQSRRKPYKNPREALTDQVNDYIRKRKQKRQASIQKKAEKKRKLHSRRDANSQKASRKTENEDAAQIVHLKEEKKGEGIIKSEPDCDHGLDDLTCEAEGGSEQGIPGLDKLDAVDFEVKRDLIENARRFGMPRVARLFGSGNAVHTSSGGLMIKKMISPLWEQQARAVLWMVYQEEIPVGPRGGVLAADMGTGKTVMSLGVITGNPALDEDLRDYSQATLVVVPSQKVARQWEEKIAEHCSKEFSSKCRWHKSQDSRAPIYFEKMNIVITTYHEVIKQLPRSSLLRKIEKKWDDPKLREKMMKSSSPSTFFYTKWYRVILDEAHKISNRETKTFQACRKLRAKYRWCLSGTPLTNTDEELYPYITFLACDFAKSIGTFQQKFKAECEAASSGKSGSRPHLDALVQMILYRYKISADIVLGGSEDLRIPLSAEESLIFNLITSRRPGKAMRQKQAVSHFFNLEHMFSSSFTSEEIQSLLNELENLDDRCSVLDLLSKNLQNSPVLDTYATGFQIMKDVACNAMIGDFSFEPFLFRIQQELTEEYEKCTHCKVQPRSWQWVQSSNCKHRYCTDCLTPTASKVDQCSDPDCTEKVVFDGPCKTLSKLSIVAAGKEWLGKGRDSHGNSLVRPSERNPAHLLSDLELIPVPPSTKLVMATAVILTWRREHPEDKIVVFIEYLTTAKVLGTMLRKAGERFLYLFGTTGDIKGQAVLNSFRSTSRKRGVPILLAGLGCCSEAINLIEANRVITIDLWWNAAREQQAFGRVHRIGQEKPTYLVRIVSDGDKRIEELQEQKLGEINYALQEDGHKIKRLKGEDLNDLFDEDSDENEEAESTEDDESDSEMDPEAGNSHNIRRSTPSARNPRFSSETEDEMRFHVGQGRLATENLDGIALLQQAVSGGSGSTEGSDEMQIDSARGGSAAKTEEGEMPGISNIDTGYGEQDDVMSG